MPLICCILFYSNFNNFFFNVFFYVINYHYDFFYTFVEDHNFFFDFIKRAVLCNQMGSLSVPSLFLVLHFSIFIYAYATINRAINSSVICYYRW